MDVCFLAQALNEYIDENRYNASHLKLNKLTHRVYRHLHSQCLLTEHGTAWLNITKLKTSKCCVKTNLFDHATIAWPFFYSPVCGKVHNFDYKHCAHNKYLDVEHFGTCFWQPHQLHNSNVANEQEIGTHQKDNLSEWVFSFFGRLCSGM